MVLNFLGSSLRDFTVLALINLTGKAKESLHPWVKVDQAGRPLPPKRLSILEGLTLNLLHCAVICVFEVIWTFGCL